MLPCPFLKIEYDFGCVDIISGAESGIGDHSSTSVMFHCIHFILIAMGKTQIYFFS